jgi:hypothetical protein
LTSITVGSGVTSIGNYAFGSYYNQFGNDNPIGLYFQGNAPTNLATDAFTLSAVIVYYLPGTAGWDSQPGPAGLGPRFDGVLTALWTLPCPLILNNSPGFGLQTNGFSFIISWATNLSVVVEACSNLAQDGWSPVSTNALTNGWSSFCDPQWTNYPSHFYRLSSGPVLVTTASSNCFTCITNSGEILITGSTCPNGALNIPGTINGLPVTAIESWALWNCYSLTSVTIPSSVTYIGVRAFALCSSLNGLCFAGTRGVRFGIAEAGGLRNVGDPVELALRYPPLKHLEIKDRHRPDNRKGRIPCTFPVLIAPRHNSPFALTSCCSPLLFIPPTVRV